MGPQPSEAGLSSRGLEYESAGAIRKLVATIWEDAYHHESNTNGTIDLGTSENYIMNSDVAAFIKENVHLSTIYGNDVELTLMRYQLKHQTWPTELGHGEVFACEPPWQNT